MTAPDLTGLPVVVAARPFDARRGLPIPFMTMTVDEATGEITGHDFALVDQHMVLRCATDRLCGICGNPLPYWFAFLGGPLSASARTYTTPPACVPCAEWALRLCPYLSIERHRRVSDNRLGDDVNEPEGYVDEKPTEFVMGITRDHTAQMHQGIIYFKAAAFKKVRRFTYVDGVLTEITAG